MSYSKIIAIKEPFTDRLLRSPALFFLNKMTFGHIPERLIEEAFDNVLRRDLEGDNYWDHRYINRDYQGHSTIIGSPSKYRGRSRHYLLIFNSFIPVKGVGGQAQTRILHVFNSEDRNDPDKYEMGIKSYDGIYIPAYLDFPDGTAGISLFRGQYQKRELLFDRSYLLLTALGGLKSTGVLPGNPVKRLMSNYYSLGDNQTLSWLANTMMRDHRVFQELIISGHQVPGIQKL
jgi:hypothetical protein